jgi:hypothetical protein
MGMKTILFYGAIAALFLAMSIFILVTASEKDRAWRFNRHLSLHPMQAPFDLAYNFHLKDFTSVNILISDMSTISFNTPGLPSRLASAAHIGEMLREPNPMPSIVYPIIDNSTKSRRLFGLSMHDLKMKDGAIAYNTMLALAPPASNRSNATTVDVTQPDPGNIQDMFVMTETLTLKQTAYYCPIRGPNRIEEYGDWIKRTEQPHDTFAKTYTSHMEFSYTSIHEKKCHAQRSDSMVMAHVAVDLYSVFSTHSTFSLLLGVTLLGFAFASFAAINSLYRHIDDSLQDKESETKSSFSQDDHRKKEMQLHTLTTLLKLVCVVMVVAFLSVEYVYKTGHADWTKNKVIPTSSMLCIFCSSVLAFLILYMHGPSKMIGRDHRMMAEIRRYCESKEVGVKAYLESMGLAWTGTAHDFIKILIERRIFPSLDLIREKIESEGEVLIYSYVWFITIPLYFMAWYADKAYGVDIHMQLIILAIMAGCALDVIYIRMAMIIDVVWDIYIKNHRDDVFDHVVLQSRDPVQTPSKGFRDTIFELKILMWALFTVVRLTIIIIPYMLLKEECENECVTLEAFIVVFEVLPVLVPFLDQLRTMWNKEYDLDDLLKVGDASNKKSKQDVSPSERTPDRKWETWRGLIYCVVYYLALIIASFVLCVQHGYRGIAINDARLDVWSGLRTA